MVICQCRTIEMQDWEVKVIVDSECMRLSMFLNIKLLRERMHEEGLEEGNRLAGNEAAKWNL